MEPPSQNVVSGNRGSPKTRRKYREIRDTYVIMLRNAKQWENIPDAEVLRRVIITRLYSGRGQARDRGNIVGGCKPLLDAMHMVNLLVDDKDEWCRDFYGQERGDRSGVIVELEELENGCHS